MKPLIAKQVHEVIGHALDLRARLERGEPADLPTEQGTLQGLLQATPEVRQLPEYVGDRRVDVSVIGGSQQRGPEPFLGIRYALTCWLDELFILDNSPCSDFWNEHSLETALFGTRDRAYKFWDQAQLAEARPGGDALEVFYLCVALGFRGDRRGKPEKLAAWGPSVQSRVAQGLAREWPTPAELEPPTYVPPLTGRRRFRVVLMAWAAVLLLAVPVLAFLIVARVGG